MKQYCVGTKISADCIYFGIFEASGKPIEFWMEKTLKEKGCKSVLHDLVVSLNKKLKCLNISEQNVLGIGISVPGEVDRAGVMHYSTELGWGIVNIRSLLHKASKRCVAVGSSRDMAVLGEHWAAGDHAAKNMAGFMLGRTMLGSIIVHDQLVFDEQGLSGNPGELPVFHEWTDRNQKTLQLIGLDRDWQIKHICDLIEQKEPIADKIVDSVIESIVIAIQNIECIIRAEKVILFSDTDISSLLEKIRGRYEKAAIGSGKTPLTIEGSMLGNNAEIYGSAKYLLDLCLTGRKLEH